MMARHTSATLLQAMTAIARHFLAYVLLSVAFWALGIGRFLYRHRLIRRTDLRFATSTARFFERTALTLARRRNRRPT